MILCSISTLVHLHHSFKGGYGPFGYILDEVRIWLEQNVASTSEEE